MTSSPPSASKDISSLQTSSLLIACRFTSRYKHVPVAQRTWTEIAQGMEIAKTTCRRMIGKRPVASLLMPGHQRIAKLFDENFRVTR